MLLSDPQTSLPRDSRAETLLGIWREVLRKPELGLDDHFFNNGGDSIRAILMQSKARAAGIAVSLKDLHATPTVAGLLSTHPSEKPQADAILPAMAERVEAPSPQPKVVVPAPLSQLRCWKATSMQSLKLLASLTRSDGRVFHNATVTPVNLAFDAARFSKAQLETRQAHPILTARVEHEGDALFFISEPSSIDDRHGYEDLRAVAAEEQERIISARVFAERDMAFAPMRGHLVRFTVFERTPERFEILIAEHHAVLDGFSLNAVMRELVERYRGIAVETTDDVTVFEAVRPEVEGSLAAIGNFLNVLPVPTVEGADFLALARDFDRFDRAVFAHKNVSRERLLDWLGERAQAQCVFNFIQFAEPDKRLGDKHETERRFFAVDAMMPLSVDWDLSADRLHLGFQYDARRIADAKAEMIRQAFESTVTDFLREQGRGGGGQPQPDDVERRVIEILTLSSALAPHPSAKFTDIGLTSLHMVLVARRLMDAFGTRFALTDILSLKTVAELISFCRGLGGSIPLEFVELTPPRLVTPRLRLIGFQQVGVAPSIFDPWCDLVPDTVSIHGLRYPDFSAMGDFSRLPFDAFITGLVKALEPLSDAPMVFVGGCFGAVLAYETACRLSKAPKGLVLIGSAAPLPDSPAPGYHRMSDAELKSELTRMQSMPEQFLQDDAYLAPVFRSLRGMSQLASQDTPPR